jgi:hypothetical protein
MSYQPEGHVGPINEIAHSNRRGSLLFDHLDSGIKEPDATRRPSSLQQLLQSGLNHDALSSRMKFVNRGPREQELVPVDRPPTSIAEARWRDRPSYRRHLFECFSE